MCRNMLAPIQSELVAIQDSAGCTNRPWWPSCLSTSGTVLNTDEGVCRNSASPFPPWSPHQSNPTWLSHLSKLRRWWKAPPWLCLQGARSALSGRLPVGRCRCSHSTLKTEGLACESINNRDNDTTFQ